MGVRRSGTVSYAAVSGCGIGGLAGRAPEGAATRARRAPSRPPLRRSLRPGEGNAGKDRERRSSDRKRKAPPDRGGRGAPRIIQTESRSVVDPPLHVAPRGAAAAEQQGVAELAIPL